MVRRKVERMGMPQVTNIFLALFIFLSLSIYSFSIDKYSLNYKNQLRQIQIYNPFEIEVNEETTFFIMNDGEELFDKNNSWNNKSWEIDKKLESASNKIINKNIIIVAIDSIKNGNSIIDETKRYVEFFPDEVINEFPNGFRKFAYTRIKNLYKNDYKLFIVNDVIPFVERKYNISLNENNLGIIGASMGALAALNIAIEYPDLFGYVGAISTHWIGIKPIEYATLPLRKSIKGDKKTFHAIKNYIQKNTYKLKGKKLYFDYGTLGLDQNYDIPQKEINKLFDLNNINYKSTKFENHDHEASFFGKRFIGVISYLKN